MPPAADDQADEVIQGELLTPEEKELSEWARQAASSELHNAQEALKQVVTMATALLAASMAFFNQVTVHGAAKAIVGMCFIAMLVTGLIGWLPWGYTFRKRRPAEIRAVREQLKNRKWWCLLLSWGFFGLAVITTFTAVVYEATK